MKQIWQNVTCWWWYKGVHCTTFSTFLYIWTFYNNKFWKFKQKVSDISNPISQMGKLRHGRSGSLPRVTELQSWMEPQGMHSCLPPYPVRAAAQEINICWLNNNGLKGLWPFHLRHIPAMHALLWAPGSSKWPLDWMGSCPTANGSAHGSPRDLPTSMTGL